MAKAQGRLQKSRSMMLSLYSLSGVAILGTLFFMGTLTVHILRHLPGADWGEVALLFQNSLYFTTAALVLAFPVAAAVTFLSVLWATSRLAPYIQSLHHLSGQAPYLLYGLVFLFILQGSSWSFILALSFLSVSQISRRWIQISSQVKVIEIESMQSLGLNIFDIIYQLYIKRYFTVYIGHLLSVFCVLFVVVTPLLCLDLGGNNTFSIMSLEFYQNLGQQPSQSAAFALVFLLIHALRVVMDHKTSFWEVEYG